MCDAHGSRYSASCDPAPSIWVTQENRVSGRHGLRTPGPSSQHVRGRGEDVSGVSGQWEPWGPAPHRLCILTVSQRLMCESWGSQVCCRGENGSEGVRRGQRQDEKRPGLRRKSVTRWAWRRTLVYV